MILNISEHLLCSLFKETCQSFYLFIVLPTMNSVPLVNTERPGMWDKAITDADFSARHITSLFDSARIGFKPSSKFYFDFRFVWGLSVQWFVVGSGLFSSELFLFATAPRLQE